MREYINKGTFTLLLICVVFILTVVGISLVWLQYGKLKKENIQLLEVKTVKEEKREEKEEGFTNWQEYKDDRMGFSMKYPRDWEIEKVEPYLSPNDIYEIHFDRGLDSSIVITRETLTPDDLKEAEKLKGRTLLEKATPFLKEEIMEEIGNREVNLDEKKVKIDNVEFVKFCWSIEDKKLNRSEQKCNLVGNIGSDFIKIYCESERKDCDATFNEMLSTLKFTEKEEIPTGKFSIDYEKIKGIQIWVDQSGREWWKDPVAMLTRELPKYGFTQDDLKTLSVPDLATQERFSTDITKFQFKISHKDKDYLVTVIQPFPGKGKIWVISEIKLE